MYFLSKSMWFLRIIHVIVIKFRLNHEKPCPDALFSDNTAQTSTHLGKPSILRGCITPHHIAGPETCFITKNTAKTQAIEFNTFLSQSFLHLFVLSFKHISCTANKIKPVLYTSHTAHNLCSSYHIFCMIFIIFCLLVLVRLFVSFFRA